MIVSDMAGTTRDAVDSYFENQKASTCSSTPRYAQEVQGGRPDREVLRPPFHHGHRAQRRVPHPHRRQEGVTEQDTKVAGLAHEAGKACIIVVNKWDAIEKDGKTMDKMRQDVMRDLSYMTYAPIVFISA